MDGVYTTAVLRFNPWLFGGAADSGDAILPRTKCSSSAKIDFKGLKEVAKALTLDWVRLWHHLSPLPGTTAVAANLFAKLTELLDEIHRALYREA